MSGCNAEKRYDLWTSLRPNLNWCLGFAYLVSQSPHLIYTCRAIFDMVSLYCDNCQSAVLTVYTQVHDTLSVDLLVVDVGVICGINLDIRQGISPLLTEVAVKALMGSQPLGHPGKTFLYIHSEARVYLVFVNVL